MRHRGDNDKWDKRHNSRVEVSAEQALADFAELFQAKAFNQRADGDSFYIDNTLYIDSLKVSREKVFVVLHRYFTRKRLPKGYRVSIEDVPLVWTQVSISPTYQRADKKYKQIVTQLTN